MNEKAFNTILANNFRKHGFAYKIPDPMVRKIKNKEGKLITVTSPARPFDGFAVTELGFIFWEAKFIKTNNLFQYSNITNNQLSSLKNISQQINAMFSGAYFNLFYSLIILGIWRPRKHIEILAFDIRYIWDRIKEGKKSLSKDQINYFLNNSFYTSCKSQEINVYEMLGNVIR